MHYTAWACALLFGLASVTAQAGEDKPRVTEGDTPAVKVSTNALQRVHVFVSGKVQGVGFRNFTTFEATTLKLTGWVRNLEDGRVELVAEGPAANIEKLMAAVAKGPDGARVDKVERKEEPCTGEFKLFETYR